MALPPLPENNTDRLFLFYTTGGGITAQEHNFSIRYDSALVTPADLMNGINTMLSVEGQSASFFTGWRFLRAENQAKGSQIRLPVPVPIELLAFVGSGGTPATPAQQVREVRFQGRGLVSGRRVSLSLYGIADSQIGETDFRFTPSPSSTLGDWIAMLSTAGAAGTAFTTIAGDPTRWYNYVNWQGNSHWETELRA